MALSFWQRMQVAFRGWSRRREEDAKRRQAEFLRSNTGWGKVDPAMRGCPVDPAPAPQPGKKAIDLEGLQTAYLDSSGAIAYYLDVESGEVVERPAADAVLSPPRYQRAPTRSAESDAEDRAAFTQTVENADVRQALMAARDAGDFRKAVAADRSVERAWYNFKNDRATSAIESWLRRLGLR